ncbi:MAG TPA: hypothetical protein VH592_09345 [Gemmataceae bacterium]|jgi:hypothetical protein
MNDSRCGMVPVENQATAFAAVYTLRKSLGFDRAALRAFPARPSRVNRDGSFTGSFRLVDEKAQKHSPSGIRDGLSELRASQALDVSLLKTNEIKAIDQSPRFTMREVAPLRGNALVQMSCTPNGPPPVAASFGLA